MPLYNFHCDDCGWEKDRLFHSSGRPSEIDCNQCSGQAKYRISVSKHQSNSVRYTTSYSKEKLGLSLHEFKCQSCEHVFEEVIDHGKGESVQDQFTCPECCSIECAWKPSVQIDRFSEQFPKYDRGLGVWLKNKQHRLQVCKERGLTPVDGDYDEEKIFSDFDDRRDKEEKEYNDYVDRLDNAPEFREYRKAVDQGKIKGVSNAS